MNSRKLTATLAALGILLLILNSKTAIAGARDGIDLCIRTVIPSLFPFFVLSMLLTNAMSGIHSPLFRPLSKLCGIPTGSEILLITGLLGGYPVGAQAVAQACRSGQLTKKDGERMLGFCSNAGPSFFFGILPMQFRSSFAPLALWLIHIVSALTVGAILPGKSGRSVRLPHSSPLGINGAVRRSIGITAGVCAWIVLFRILIAFQALPLSLAPKPIGIGLIGLLELANGCCELTGISQESTRFIICSALLAFGGLCVCMQTVSATDGLGLGLYLPGKLLQTGISVLLAATVSPILYERSAISPVLILPIILVTAIIYLVVKKSVAFPQEMVYN